MEFLGSTAFVSVRLIGRWTMTALVVNTVIGSGIFGVPSELIRLLGRASPLAMILAALAMTVIMLPVAEVASQFSVPGGMYLYARRAFGRFMGLQVGWFWLLAIIGGGAAGANLFLSYLAAVFPAVIRGPLRVSALLVLVAIPAVVNYLGVRGGVRLSLLLTLVKLAPIGLVIVLGFLHFLSGKGSPAAAPEAAADWKAWLSALLLLTFSYSGYEDALVPAGDVKQPRWTIPFALITGLLICCFVYTALQWVIVATIGARGTDHPLSDTASILLGRSGASFVSVAVMMSTYGWISGAFFNAPRLATALAEEGDGPAWLGRMHPRYQTPSAGILLFALAVFLLSATGTFLWAIALTAGSAMIIYAVSCAALIRLRHLQPDTPAMRVPFGPVLAAAGIVISATLLSQVDCRHLALMSLTCLIAIANWLWVRRR